eukprot:2982338-Pleurochrysis_carterae.AAC.2
MPDCSQNRSSTTLAGPSGTNRDCNRLEYVFPCIRAEAVTCSGHRQLRRKNRDLPLATAGSNLSLAPGRMDRDLEGRLPWNDSCQKDGGQQPRGARSGNLRCVFHRTAICGARSRHRRHFESRGMQLQQTYQTTAMVMQRRQAVQKWSILI